MSSGAWWCRLYLVLYCNECSIIISYPFPLFWLALCQRPLSLIVCLFFIVFIDVTSEVVQNDYLLLRFFKCLCSTGTDNSISLSCFSRGSAPVLWGWTFIALVAYQLELDLRFWFSESSSSTLVLQTLMLSHCWAFRSLVTPSLYLLVYMYLNFTVSYMYIHYLNWNF